MTNASPVTANPLIATPGVSARWRFRVLVTLICCYFFVALEAPVLTSDAGVLLLSSGWRDAGQHWLYGCVILIAGWVALGPGRMDLRALRGLIAVGWLLPAWVLGLIMSPNSKFEVALTTLVCLTVAAVTFAVLTVVRHCSCKSLVHAGATTAEGTDRLQYSLTTLLVVMLLICMTLALLEWIDPEYRKYIKKPSHWDLGWRQGLLREVGGEALGVMLIASACVPVFLSQRKPRVAWALGLALAALTVALLIDTRVTVAVFFPLFQSNPLEPWSFDYHIANLATVTACLLIAAAAMHWLGYRFAAVTPDTPSPSPARPSPDG